MAQLHTGWHANPKILKLGLPAMGLHAWSISYCDAGLTDGFIPAGAWPALPGVKAAVFALLRAGLWAPVEGGFRLHDYAQYNRTRAQVDAYMAAKIAAGQAGGQASAQARARRRAQAHAPPSAQASAQANGKQDLKQNSTPNPGDVNSRPPARLAGRTARPRARGDAHLNSFSNGALSELPDEVRQRLEQPPIGQPCHASQA